MASTRRDALRSAAFAGAGLALSGAPGWARNRPRIARAGSFAQGIASGQPRRSSVSLWTRLTGVDGPAQVELEVATDPGFAHLLHRELVTLPGDADSTVARRVVNRGFRPGHEYFYRFSTATTSSPVGRFKTLPPRDSRATVRIGFWTCQDYRAGYFGQHRALAAEDLDLVVCLGDYIYENAGGLSRLPGRDDTTGANHDGIATTLADYRAKYSLYRSDPGLRALHQRHAMCWLWDDHEVVNDYWRDGNAGAVVAGFAERRTAAYRAWFEHVPNPPVGGRGSTRIYQSVRVGGLAELVFVDDRQYRDMQPCTDTPFAPCPDAATPGRTMLGSAQKRWLGQVLDTSNADWKVLVNGLMMMGLDQPLPGGAKFVDTWDGYDAERAELVGGWANRGRSDVVVMTGDDHDNYAGVVREHGRSGRGGAVEFVVPSVTSDNTSELLGGSDAAGIAGEQNALAINPHLVYADQRHHGYCVLEVRPDAVEVVFKHAASRADPATTVSEAARFRVARGRVTVETV